MGMSNNQILQFIELYKEQRLIWDPHHPDNKNRPEVSAAWIKIESSLGFDFTVSELKRKKESLMARYRVLLKKKKENPNYKITWFAYDPLDEFLSNIQKYTDDDNKSGLINNSTSTSQLESEFFDSSEYKTENISDPISCYEHVPENHSALKRPKINNKCMFKCTNKTSDSEEHQELDECDLYATLLAKKLKKLNEYQRDLVMHEIDNIIFRAKMKGATQNTSYSTTQSEKMKSPIIIVTQQSHAEYENESISYTQNSHIVEDP